MSRFIDLTQDREVQEIVVKESVTRKQVDDAYKMRVTGVPRGTDKKVTFAAAYGGGDLETVSRLNGRISEAANKAIVLHKTASPGAPAGSWTLEFKNLETGVGVFSIGVAAGYADMLMKGLHEWFNLMVHEVLD